MTVSSKLQKKPAVLRRKNIKNKTGKQSQAKQIIALDKGLTKLTKQNFARVRTSWKRDKISIIPTTLGDRIYICPIPYAACDPLNTAGVLNTWQDNMGGGTATGVPYSKRFVFGYPKSAVNSNLAYHTGGVLRYQLISTSNNFEQIGLYLIRPKKAMADQLTIDRKLKQRGTAAGMDRPGSESELHNDLDYVIHTGAGSLTANQTFFGSEINKKYWDVLYHKEIGFSHPGATGQASNVNAANASPLSNAIIRNGTIRIPAGGVLKNSSFMTTTGSQPSSSALEMGFLDQANEHSCYLVILQNGIPSGATNTILGGFIVNDYYKCVV